MEKLGMGYMGNLYHILNFSVNPKLYPKIKLFFFLIWWLMYHSKMEIETTVRKEVVIF